MRHARAKDAAHALALLGAMGPGARVFAGATTFAPVTPDPLPALGVDVSGADFGSMLEIAGGAADIAANAPLEALRRDPALRAALPPLADLLARVGAMAVRNLATLGGGVIWPGGDLRAALAPLGAEAVFAKAGAVPVEDAAQETGDVLTRIRIPLPAPGAWTVEKLGHRERFSPAKLILSVHRGDGPPRLALGAAGRGLTTGTDPGALLSGLGRTEARIARAMLSDALERTCA
ncbi:FAD binding domain-containing protein [Rhodovulum sp. DZ06]|uniref:FAD binding domain-containing protein n=1 Tax=Rhodovulum sp. DZ06 TaxID=3425126 RepID=UPI003D35715C